MTFDISAAKKKHSVKKHDERKRRERLLELEKEETSSTTTESSGVDPDEKVHLHTQIQSYSMLIQMKRYTCILKYKVIVC